jgi:hypothetical protein
MFTDDDREAVVKLLMDSETSWPTWPYQERNTGDISDDWEKDLREAAVAILALLQTRVRERASTWGA